MVWTSASCQSLRARKTITLASNVPSSDSRWLPLLFSEISVRPSKTDSKRSSCATRAISCIGSDDTVASVSTLIFDLADAFSNSLITTCILSIGSGFTSGFQSDGTTAIVCITTCPTPAGTKASASDIMAVTFCGLETGTKTSGVRPRSLFSSGLKAVLETSLTRAR